MNISLSWLKQYINIDLKVETVSQALTDIGLEVGGIEEIQTVKGGLEGLVIGEVLTCESHPNADKLSVTTVNVGNNTILPIVCGAPNVKAGQKVIVATVGTQLYDGDTSFLIKKSKIRGEVSEGMICAEDEIGLGTSHDGIMVLDNQAIVGTLAKDYFNIQSDFQLEVDLTPNRIDAASHIGVARDLAAYLSQTNKEICYNWPSVDAFKVDNTDYSVQVTVENPEACARYSGVTISGVEVKDSPQWLQDKLKAIGMNPVNNIVDVTNFVLHETGQPLHAFDGEKITGNKVIVKTLDQGTKFTTLDELERELSSEDLMICNASEPMCIAGVFGGLHSGVSKSTKKIFLESAYFNPVSVRKTSKRQTINTDSSFRFERGTDANNTIYALKRAALLIKEVAGGSISSEVVDYYPEPIKPKEVTLTFNNINRLIGALLPSYKVVSILKSLEFEIVSQDETTLVVKVPTYRVDVTREADVIEEILRIYGYNTVEISHHVNSTIIHSVKPDDHKLKNTISTILNGLGYTEIMSNSLNRTSYYQDLTTWSLESTVELFNPLSQDLNGMRQTLLFGGLESIAHNRNHKRPNLRLFEFGNCYALKATDTKPLPLKAYNENQALAIFLTGNINDQSWLSKEAGVSFYDLKAVVENVLVRLEIKKSTLKINEFSSDIWNGGLEYKTQNNQILVRFGSLSKAVLNKLKIDAEVFYAEFNWDIVLKMSTMSKTLFHEINRYPEVKRDLALLVDKNVKYASLEELAFKTESKLLQRVNLFDVYEGKGVPEGKKSYALSFYLQDSDKSLVDKVIDKTMNKLMGAYQHVLKAEVRGK